MTDFKKLIVERNDHPDMRYTCPVKYGVERDGMLVVWREEGNKKTIVATFREWSAARYG